MCFSKLLSNTATPCRHLCPSVSVLPISVGAAPNRGASARYGAVTDKDGDMANAMIVVVNVTTFLRSHLHKQVCVSLEQRLGKPGINVRRQWK